MAIVELPDHGLSAGKAARGKHWIKQLDRVNRTVQTGYAFEGTFKKWNETVEVPEGTWFLTFIEDLTGSGRVRDQTVALWRVQNGELTADLRWELDGSPGWALKVRDPIADRLEGDDHPELPSVADAFEAWVSDEATRRGVSSGAILDDLMKAIFSSHAESGLSGT
ncbi:hypothetical protein ACFP2T_43400 [Plantactinospora solaniradicis]|uniref:DUF402 domain-containing protein n=1 Tax=Plantactinospora solaniradicis TaxID=1723736 RepID=A0ABW1KNF4_9ACTN